MAKRLFIGGLPYSTTEDELRSLLSQAGELESVNVIIDRYTNQSKGFAFAEYKNDDDAKKAIETLNETELGGRKIIVAEARPMEERRDDRRSFGGGGGRGGFGGGRRDDRRGGGGFRGGSRGGRW